MLKKMYFLVLADKTRDITAICIKWADAEFVIQEHLIGLVHVKKTDANSLTVAILEV